MENRPHSQQAAGFEKQPYPQQPSQMGKKPRPQQAYGRSGTAWAQWEYTPDEWAAFDQLDWVPVRNRSLLILVLSPIIFLAIITISVLWGSPDQVGPLLALFILLLTPFIWLMIAAIAALVDTGKRHRARRNPAESPRVTLTGSGLWIAGTYFPLREGFWHIKWVKMTTNPTVLHFKLRQTGIIEGHTTNIGLVSTRTIHIPVPRSHEVEAEQLWQRYDDVVSMLKKKPEHPEPV